VSSQQFPSPDSEPEVEAETGPARAWWLATPRLGYAIVAGAAWLLLGAVYGPLSWLAALWWVAVIAAAALELAALGRASQISARRVVEPVLSLGAANQVRLALRNRSGQDLRCCLRDEPPLDFEAGRLRLSCELRAGGETMPVYLVTPRKRGDYAFGKLEARLTTGLGVVARQLRFDLSQRVKVYPNLTDIRSYQLQAQKQRLQDIGVHPMRSASIGMEFESLRAYVPGDEPRRIDWKATARHGKPITRLYDIERSQHVVLCLDLGRTMLSELGVLSKADHAVNAAALVAHVAARSGDWVGLFAFSGRPGLFVPPRKSQFGLILDSLYGLQAERVESDYRRSFLEAAHRIRKRALIILLTDLVDPDSSARLVRNVSLLTRRHLVLCGALSDYELYELARQSPTEPRKLYERTVASALLSDRQRALAALRERGAIAFDATPENLSVAVLNHYLEIKAKARL